MEKINENKMFRSKSNLNLLHENYHENLKWNSVFFPYFITGCENWVSCLEIWLNVVDCDRADLWIWHLINDTFFSIIDIDFQNEYLGCYKR